MGIFNFQEALTRLANATNLIAGCETDLAQKRQQLREAERELEAHRQELLLGVYAETDSNGKARYTNEAMRGAALSMQLARTSTAQSLQRLIDGLSNDSAMLQVNRDNASRQRQDLLALMAYAASENYRLMPVPQMSGTR